MKRLPNGFNSDSDLWKWLMIIGAMAIAFAITALSLKSKGF